MRLKTTLAILILSFLFAKCGKEEKQTKVSYYDVYSSKNEVSAYYKIVSNSQNNIRVDTISRFKLDGEKVDVRVEKYVVTTDTLYKISFDNKQYPYLIINKNKCNLINQTEEVETCLIVNEEHLIFTEQTLITDGIKKKLTFDKQFNLIENEYLDGFLSYYKISKRDDKPGNVGNVPKKDF